MIKNVLGVKIDDVTMNEALSKVQGWLKEKGKHYIVTPNPEIIVNAQYDKEYKTILNNADLSIPDGIGLKLSGQVQNHVTGVDLMEELIKHSGDWGSTIGFLGGGKGVAERAAICLRKKYPNAKIVYANDGGVIDSRGKWVEGDRQALLPLDVLCIGFGPPKQEFWISKNLDNIPVKIAMGVGGSLDYFSGNIPRAPKILRVLGLEWLFRVVIQPWRIKRQMALIKYVLLLLKK